MWRKCDLHRHTTPHAKSAFEFDPQNFLMECTRDGLDVVAVTDHDRTDHIDSVVEEAANHNIIVVPGTEISTDRGHVLALAPGVEGRIILDELCNRVPVMDSTTVQFSRLANVLSEQRFNGTGPFRNHVILIGAHVDVSGSILGPSQAPSVADQVSHAQHLQALEVVHSQNHTAWRQGIKQTDVVMALLRGSDAHPTVNYETRSTWIYLPEVTLQCLRHALATHEASISHEQHPPPEPEFWIKAIRFDGGPYNGRRIEFSPRANALIGPPSSGKSLIIDAIRYVFDLPCAIDDVRASIERRLAKCLPDGATVTVEVESSDGHRELRRVRGGTTAPKAREAPILFSQVELARRSMEPIPSVALLDIHCPQAAVHKGEIKKISDEFRSAFRGIVSPAAQARVLRLEVENEQEGLEATRSAYLSLVGDEKTAKSLGDLGRLETWHRVARQRLEEWRGAFQIPAGPELPSAPELETGLAIGDYVPSNAIPEALDEYRKAVSSAADELVATLRVESDTRSPRVESLRGDIQARLGGGKDATPELAGEAEQCRARLFLRKLTGDDPVPFDNLTEGLKALAIKEVSFAASQLPAVTDQPEDAVPTTAIFENLVPTLREQRASRQFIIASHDANVVVSGDMERVIVLPPEASEQPVVGTLFDASVRASALALLEGGDRAFELRRRRYGNYG